MVLLMVKIGRVIHAQAFEIVVIKVFILGCWKLHRDRISSWSDFTQTTWGYFILLHTEVALTSTKQLSTSAYTVAEQRGQGLVTSPAPPPLLASSRPRILQLFQSRLFRKPLHPSSVVCGIPFGHLLVNQFRRPLAAIVPRRLCVRERFYRASLAGQRLCRRCVGAA